MLWWIAETSGTVALIAVVALAATWAGRLSPACRHAFWVLAMTRLVMPPVVHLPPLSLAALGIRAAVQVSADRSARHTPGALSARRGQREEAAPVLIEPVVTFPHSSSPAASAIAAHSSSALLGCWLAGTFLFVSWQALRIRRFHRSVKALIAAPSWLTSLLENLAVQFGVRPPAVSMVTGLGSPLLWCLGRPVLLLPVELLERLDVSQWGKILAHELAHIRRRDHWFSKASLAVGLIWWWNPLYWLIRWRLAVEAELACDAWVVRARPEDRLIYARTLVDVCEFVAAPAPVSPALGVSSAGPILERRLRMIMSGQIACRMNLREFLVAGLLTLLALPSWSRGQSAPVMEDISPKAERPGQARSRPDARAEAVGSAKAPPLVLPVAIGTIDIDLILKSYEKTKVFSEQLKRDAATKNRN